jgi:hypothetical protein
MAGNVWVTEQDQATFKVELPLRQELASPVMAKA